MSIVAVTDGGSKIAAAPDRNRPSALTFDQMVSVVPCGVISRLWSFPLA